jgi:deoxyribodipyrimidine photo-lyase
MKPPVNIMWFRRDLRLNDNAALYHALKSNHPVVPVFMFDTNILAQLESKTDRRVTFIHDALEEMQLQLNGLKSTLEVYYGTPQKIFNKLFKEYSIEKVFTNHDYEPYAVERDNSIEKLIEERGATFHSFKDQVIFEKNEVTKDDGTPYTIFTPYANKWRAKLEAFYLKSYPAKKYSGNFYKQQIVEIPSLESMGFQKSSAVFPVKNVPDELVRHYTERRDFPSIENGTSHMGVHLRFGTVSIRELAKRAQKLNATYLNELTWRDFYQMILWHFPKVGKGFSFKAAYDNIKWRNNEKEFQRWCEGKTGYPIVDAGMRELNATGFMHNRVRMITASFLTKHLLIDWRWGEAYFAEKLLDYDLAANNGGWQWAAGSGCDAAPYFRVFNPALQTHKFDKDLKYIRKWVPELEELTYPQPVVVHEEARKRVLEVYANALKEK